MRLLLHAGTEKTGSSYLQTAFNDRSGDLATRGIHYPTGGFQQGD